MSDAVLAGRRSVTCTRGRHGRSPRLSEAPRPGPLRRRLLRGVPAVRPAGARSRPDGRGRPDRHPRRRVGLVDVGARGRAFRARLARARARRRPRARHQRDPRHADLRDAAVARAQVPGGAAERQTGERIPYGHRQDADYSHPAFRWHADRIIRAGRRPLRRAPGDHRLPGRQRAGHGALPQPRRVRDLRRPAARALRRRRDAQRDAGASSTGRTASAAGTTCGRRTATPCRPTTSRGGASSRQLTTDFIAAQAAIVRELARPDQFVTTCMALSAPRLRPARPQPRAWTSPRSTPTTRCRTR